MKWNLREEMELISYIICAQSGYNGTGKSRYDEDAIKCKIRKKVEKDFHEYWKLDEDVTYCVDFFISFIAIYLTYMNLKQSKYEKKFGEMKKEMTRNRKEEKRRNIENIRKYRDKKWDKIERRRVGHVLRNKEVDQEAIRMIVNFRNRWKKESRGEYQHLQKDLISYVYRSSHTISNEKWKEH
jgi:hypothetical protein